MEGAQPKAGKGSIRPAMGRMGAPRLRRDPFGPSGIALCLFAAALMAGCGLLNLGQPGAPGDGALGTGTVRVIIHWPAGEAVGQAFSPATFNIIPKAASLSPRESGDPPSAGAVRDAETRIIPQAATVVDITISAADISPPITAQIVRPANSMDLLVPSGTARSVACQAKDGAGTVLSEATVVTDVPINVVTTVTVTLTATDAATPDIVIASVSPSIAYVGQTVNFSGSASDSDGTITLYEWDFNYDGATFMADFSSAATGDTTHVYATAATYTAAFRATDNDGLTAMATVTITVTAAMGRIAFVSNRAGSNDEIFVMNEDGTGQTRLTNNYAIDYYPAWSPDGMKIAFTSWRDAEDPMVATGNSEVYVMNADGTEQTNLTNNTAPDMNPCWSPDGTKIAFSSGRDGNMTIYVMNADGTGQTRLTNDPAQDDFPAWSPDGTKITFFSNRDGGKIYVMNADGTGQTSLDAAGWWPDWSPDGTKIAFSSARDGTGFYEIYVMNADGTGQTRLTNNTVHDRDPAWSPDGTKIAFTFHDVFAPDPGAYDDEIYVMNADGTGQTNLTNNSVSDRKPTWTAAFGSHEVTVSAARHGNDRMTDGERGTGNGEQGTD